MAIGAKAIAAFPDDPSDSSHYAHPGDLAKAALRGPRDSGSGIEAAGTATDCRVPIPGRFANRRGAS
jgi:hypothetical protein